MVWTFSSIRKLSKWENIEDQRQEIKRSCSATSPRLIQVEGNCFLILVQVGTIIMAHTESSKHALRKALTILCLRKNKKKVTKKKISIEEKMYVQTDTFVYE